MIAWKVAHEAITMKPAPLHGETTTPEQAARDRAKKLKRIATSLRLPI